MRITKMTVELDDEIGSLVEVTFNPDGTIEELCGCFRATEAENEKKARDFANYAGHLQELIEQHSTNVGELAACDILEQIAAETIPATIDGFKAASRDAMVRRGGRLLSEEEAAKLYRLIDKLVAEHPAEEEQ